MAYVAIGHQEAMRPNHRVFGRLVGAVDRDVFPENVMVSDGQPGVRALVSQILRRLADHAARTKAVAGADAGTTCYR